MRSQARDLLSKAQVTFLCHCTSPGLHTSTLCTFSSWDKGLAPCTSWLLPLVWNDRAPGIQDIPLPVLSVQSCGQRLHLQETSVTREHPVSVLSCVSSPRFSGIWNTPGWATIHPPCTASALTPNLHCVMTDRAELYRGNWVGVSVSL